MYDYEEVRKHLKEYHKHTDVKIDGLKIVDGEIIIIDDDENDFFNLDKDITLNTDESIENIQAIDHISYMERLFQDLEEVTTHREYGICVFRSRGYTYERIGKVFGLCRERIRQIENKALRKLEAAYKDE